MQRNRASGGSGVESNDYLERLGPAVGHAQLKARHGLVDQENLLLIRWACGGFDAANGQGSRGGRVAHGTIRLSVRASFQVCAVYAGRCILEQL